SDGFLLFGRLAPCPSASFTAGRALLGGFSTDELDEGHLRSVAPPEAELDDPGISSRPIFEARPDGIEQLAYNRLVLNDAQSLAARVQITAFAERNHAIGPAAQLLRLGIRRAD